MMLSNNILRIVAALVAVASLAESFATSPSTIGNTKKHIPAAASSTSSLHALANPFKSKRSEAEEDTKPKKKKTGQRSNILHIETINDYKEEVVDEKEQITVVRFYSRYCRSCRASEPLFYKLASDFQEQGVKFVEVPLTKDTNVLHEALGVPSLPWTHIYHPDAGLVEERKVSKKFIDEVRNSLRCYVYGECDLDDAPADCMNVYGECAIED